VLGTVLALRPFTSAEVLVLLAGLGSIASGVLTLTVVEDRSVLHRLVVGVGWAVLGVVILVWPDLSVESLAVVVGVALVVDGLVDGVKALTGRSEEPTAELIGGGASVVFGVLALSWPDVTVFVVAVLFGVRTVLFGLSQLGSLVTAWRRPAVTGETSRPKRRGWFVRGVRVVTRLVALVLALGLLAVSVAFRRAETEVSAFYDTPEDVPSTPGELIRDESLADSIPDDAEGWRILYSTTDSVGEPAVGSAFVLASRKLPSSPRPVVLWDHGTVGVARPCAPSLFDDVTVGVPAVPQALDSGWVIVAPDYAGMGTEGVAPYLIGTGQAYSALDAVRAARQLEDLSIADQTVVWGHSQGGNAALWTGILADDYAPDVPLAGVAALSPATALVPLAESVQNAAAGSVVLAFVLEAYSGTYDDVNVDDYVRPGARAQVREAAERCLTDPGLIASVVAASSGESIFATDLSEGPLGDRLRENTPTADVGGVPLLVAQGTGDEVIDISITEAWVPEQCAAGYELDFRTYPDFSHMGVLDAPSPLPDELNAWTADRFAGNPAESTC
jgi:uncharacterized membrane protein HdeD (DUF308 family)/acetyl esterase/lipase